MHTIKKQIQKIFDKAMPLWLFNLVAAVLLASVYNFVVWKRVIELYPPSQSHSVPLLFLIFIVLTSFFYICLSIFSFFKLHKIVLIPIVIFNTASLYFMNQYSIMIDITMLQNVVQTDTREAAELISPLMLCYFVFLGAIPAWLICKVKIKPFKNLVTRLFAFIVPFIVIGLVAATSFQQFSSLVRNHKDLRYVLLPNNYVNASFKLVKSYLPHAKVKVDEEAKIEKDASWNDRKKKTLFVLVLGETARADNFSLNGYERNTNPLLAKEDIINFPDVHSCGTSTAASVPCLFSPSGRKNFNPSKENPRNNLFQIISRAGIKSVWIDNNSGCKGVCDNAETDMKTSDGSESYDMAMLPALDKAIGGAQQDMFIVLHQKGSHGPAYYLRTPESFWQYKPICKTEELMHCTRDEIRNSYDNTILYTDYFLSQLLQKLKSLSEQYNVAMIYFSDHGESLGENNLYLHGLPYAIAPDKQKHVPFFMWISDGFANAFAIDKTCLRQKSKESFSHDNVYHSVIDALSLDTLMEKQELSIFAGCKKGSHAK